MATGSQQKLDSALATWLDWLSNFSHSGELSRAAIHVLNLDGENALPQAKGRLKSFEAQLKASVAQNLPEFILLSADEMNGARGAYAPSTNTIYLNEEWLRTAVEEEVLSVIMEEFGSFLDDQLNKVDTPGDEGSLFGANLLGVELSDAEISAIQSENDSITIRVDGQDIEAEGNISLSSFLDLSSLDGNNGFVANGIERGTVFDDWNVTGRSVSFIGDFNGDGFDDVIIGAPGADPNGLQDAGQSYVVFGNSEGFSGTLELSSLDGSNGFMLNGIYATSSFGFSVSGAGDFNGDGFDDLIIGAYSADPRGLIDAGQAYIMFGGTTFSNNPTFPPSLSVSGLWGSKGFIIDGVSAEYLGYSVSSAGDFNGDGFDDLIIGARNSSGPGEKVGASYLIFGSARDYPSGYFDLSTLDGTNGLVIKGIDEYNYLGTSVSGAGDVNGDGFDDLIISAPGVALDGKSSVGQSYVVFGSDAVFSGSFDLSSLDGSNGFIINGINLGDSSGISVSNGGDVNGDGFDDLIIGARSADPNEINYAGQSYVVFGSSSPFSRTLDLSSLNGRNGFAINGINENDYSGYSVSSAGDFNDDGFDDLIVGAYAYAANNTGQSYVIYGSDADFSSSLDLSSLDGSNGFFINGLNTMDYLGISVGGSGDFNGDNIDDLIIGAQGSYTQPEGSNAGRAYVIYGAPSSIVATISSEETNILISQNGAGLINVESYTKERVRTNEKGPNKWTEIATYTLIEGNIEADSLIYYSGPSSTNVSAQGFSEDGSRNPALLSIQIFTSSGEDVLIGGSFATWHEPGGVLAEGQIDSVTGVTGAIDAINLSEFYDARSNGFGHAVINNIDIADGDQILIKGSGITPSAGFSVEFVPSSDGGGSKGRGKKKEASSGQFNIYSDQLLADGVTRDLIAVISGSGTGFTDQTDPNEFVKFYSSVLTPDQWQTTNGDYIFS